MEHPKILLADQHTLVLDSLREVLREEFEIVGGVTDGRAALAAYETLRPDVLLLEISLPILNGIEVVGQLRKKFPKALLILVTMYNERTFVNEAFRAGASGYVPKQASGGELRQAIRTVLNGQRYVSPHVFSDMASDPVSSADSADHFGRSLTPRQREVLQLVAEGKSMKAIAHILGVSVRTVEFHKNSVTTTLGLRSVAELTRYAVRQKICL